MIGWLRPPFGLGMRSTDRTIHPTPFLWVSMPAPPSPCILHCTQADLAPAVSDGPVHRDDPPIHSRLLQAAMGLLSDPAAHEEGPGIATGISPVALIFSLPLLTCTAWQRTVCIFVQPLSAATHRWHLRRP